VLTGRGKDHCKIHRVCAIREIASCARRWVRRERNRSRQRCHTQSCAVLRCQVVTHAKSDTTRKQTFQQIFGWLRSPIWSNSIACKANQSTTTTPGGQSTHRRTQKIIRHAYELLFLSSFFSLFLSSYLSYTSCCLPMIHVSDTPMLDDKCQI
jgi:hypothetical protein